jgi:hypothetical protein
MHTNIEISLNPLTDGFMENTACADAIRADRHVLIIGTNGNMRLTDMEEGREILEAFATCGGSLILGDSAYIVMFNDRKVFDLEEGRFFVGSMVVMKMCEGTLAPLSDEEINEAQELLMEHMATLVSGNQRFSALALG